MKNIWRAELTVGLGVKLALVALKCDLRDDEGTKERLARYGEKCISYEEGLEMAKHIRAVRYLGSQLQNVGGVNGRMFGEA